jgi:hypothetical protein
VPFSGITGKVFRIFFFSCRARCPEKGGSAEAGRWRGWRGQLTGRSDRRRAFRRVVLERGARAESGLPKHGHGSRSRGEGRWGWQFTGALFRAQNQPSTTKSTFQLRTELRDTRTPGSYLLAPHTSGPRDVPRCEALSYLQKTLHYMGGRRNCCYAERKIVRFA